MDSRAASCTVYDRNRSNTPGIYVCVVISIISVQMRGGRTETGDERKERASENGTRSFLICKSPCIRPHNGTCVFLKSDDVVEFSSKFKKRPTEECHAKYGSERKLYLHRNSSSLNK